MRYFSCLFSVLRAITPAPRILQTGNSFLRCSSLYSLAIQYAILRTPSWKQFGHIPEPNTDGKRFCTKTTSQRADLLNIVLNSKITCSIIKFPYCFSSMFKHIMHWQYRSLNKETNESERN